MKVGYKQFIAFSMGLLILLFTVFELFFVVEASDPYWTNKYATICLIQYVYCVIAWRYLKIGFFTPKTLFLIFLILFHEGNLLVQAWMPMTEYEERVLMLNRYGQDNALKASQYVIIFIFVYCLLTVLFHKNTEGQTINGNATKFSNSATLSNRIRVMGIVFLLMSILPTLYTDFKLFIGRSIEGYVGVYNTDVSFYGMPLGYFTKMFFPAFVLLLIGNKNNKKKFIVIMTASLCYYVVRMMLIGRKADSILAILPIVGLFAMYYKPKIRIGVLVGGYALTYLSTLATKLRGVPIDADFSMYLSDTIQNTSPVKDILYEMGGTIKAVMQTMMAIPDTGTYRCGLTYLWAPIGGIFSGLKISVPSISSQTQMDLFFNLPERGVFINSTVASMGGSAIAEWYFNFGWIGIFLLPIFVGAILKFDDLYMKAVSSDLTFAYANVFLYYLLRYSRQYVIELVWNPLFCITAIFLLNRMLSNQWKGTKRESNRSQ